jgi:hypothetical protein
VDAADLDARFPAERLARVTVHTSDGRVLESGLSSARGEPESPWSDEEFDAKYRWLASGLLDLERTEALLSAVRNAAGQPDVSAVFDLMAGGLTPA